ncbi:hypothetical protein VKT23_009599 [Stygiomarasmius scandens]|uniref:Heterokaryon incompatibility domain-containing protein n=1 Tax=Marasmiellus scandens TaxID=2682957 RepID=A0ABR1JE82_9AGAR
MEKMMLRSINTLAALKISPAISNMIKSIPTYLYDCHLLKLRRDVDILSELGTDSLRYLIVTHVWGQPENIKIPGVKWDVPIIEGKFEEILQYTKKRGFRWMWMDCICIRQDNQELVDADAGGHEKEAEIGRMQEYYRNASECLCIPGYPDVFLDAFHKQIELRDIIGKYNPSESLNFAEDMKRAWKNIEFLDKVLGDPWFARTWTYQELILSNNIRLLDGTSLDLEYLANVVHWYFDILYKGTLQRPNAADCEDYPYVRPGHEVVIAPDRAWADNLESWTAKSEFQKNGFLHLPNAVSLSKWKKCKYPVDKLYGLYGMIRDEEKVQVNYGEKTGDERILVERWKETMKSVVSRGLMWPLLTDAMVDHAIKGEKWIPIITADSYSWDNHGHQDNINRLKPSIGANGLRLVVRPVGHIVGASAVFGDGGGETNKLVTCVWILGAKGFDIRPIQELMRQGILGSSMERGADPMAAVEALDKALHASSLDECFAYVEIGGGGDTTDPSLRRRIRGGWNRCVVCVAKEGDQGKPMVFQAWIYGESTRPQKGKCHVFDVTSDGRATRWIIANREEDGTYTKIGSMKSLFLQSTSDTSMEITLN